MAPTFVEMIGRAAAIASIATKGPASSPEAMMVASQSRRSYRISLSGTCPVNSMVSVKSFSRPIFAVAHARDHRHDAESGWYVSLGHSKCPDGNGKTLVGMEAADNGKAERVTRDRRLDFEKGIFVQGGLLDSMRVPLIGEDG